MDMGKVKHGFGLNCNCLKKWINGYDKWKLVYGNWRLWI